MRSIFFAFLLQVLVVASVDLQSCGIGGQSVNRRVVWWLFGAAFVSVSVEFLMLAPPAAASRQMYRMAGGEGQLRGRLVSARENQ